MKAKKFPAVKGYSIKSVTKPSMKEALEQCFDSFSYRNALHVIEGENRVQKELEHELYALIFSYIGQPFYRSLIKFKIVSKTSSYGETDLQFLPENLFTLILIYLYEVPEAELIPNCGADQNLEKYDYKGHSFWFEKNGSPRAVNINVDKCETAINRFSL